MEANTLMILKCCEFFLIMRWFELECSPYIPFEH
jgi:hypothetical protein